MTRLELQVGALEAAIKDAKNAAGPPHKRKAHAVFFCKYLNTSTSGRGSLGERFASASSWSSWRVQTQQRSY